MQPQPRHPDPTTSPPVPEGLDAARERIASLRLTDSTHPTLVACRLANARAIAAESCRQWQRPQALP
jgi:hypothetical protein